MKHILVIFLALFFVFSCSENTSNKEELKAEYDLINTDQVATKQEASQAVVEPQEAPYIEGADYEKLAVPYVTEDKDHIVVYEFFGYTCPHCFYFEPFLDKWLAKKSKSIKFVRVPLNFQQGWDVMQQGYLTAQLMGVSEQAHKHLFEAIHNEHKRFNSIDELALWYASNTGVDKDEFLSSADSFLLDSKQRQADKMGFLMKVTGTPALVVNGKYRISSKIRNRDEIIDVLKYLTEKEAKEMGLFAQ
jgi:thiol:disulfide interchange protein DsbA